MKCFWHKWTKWSEPIISHYGPRFDGEFGGNIPHYKQVRFCLKCNKKQTHRFTRLEDAK